MKSPFIYFHVPRGVDSLKAGISPHILCLVLRLAMTWAYSQETCLYLEREANFLQL